MNKAFLKKLLYRLGSVLAVVGVGFMVVRLRDYAGSIDLSSFGAFVWWTLAFCAVLYGIAGFLMGNAWYCVLKHLSVPASAVWAMQVYGTSQLAKYIPGNIFHFAGRQALGMAQGLAALPLLRSTVWELFLQLTAGGFFIFLALPAYFQEISPLVAGCLFIPAVVTGVFILRRFAGPAIALAFCEDLVFLLISGLVFSVVLQMSTGGELPADLHRTTICGAFIVAWMVGFVTPGAPAGAGVRELVLLFLFSGRVPEAPLLIALVLGRGVTVGGDLIFYLLASGVGFAEKRRKLHSSAAQ